MTSNTPSVAPSRQFWRWKISICLILAMVTTAVYFPLRHYEFVNYDDDVYVTLNPHLRNGLNREAVDWSFAAGLIYSSPNVDYWRPLSYLSHALDIELFGFDPGGHHLMSLAMHVAATISLFWVLNLMTGALWRSAFVAALFALHPLHVESVAWIAERKDVLSGLFFILTLGAYTQYSGQPFTMSRYLLVLGLFGLALMSKPIVVTLPFVMLLLDYWPLGRVTGDKWRGTSENREKPSTLNPQLSTLLLEKLPFFLLAIGSGIFAVHSQKAVGAASLLDQESLFVRMGNALVSYTAYLLNLFWPVKLAVFYPYPTALPVWPVAGAVVLLAGITLLVLAAARRCPWLPVGWLWYLGMLLPVIGILQVGAQARADRYTYLSFIGLFLMITWTVGDLCPPWRQRKLVLGAAMAIVLAILTVCTSVQVSYWRDSESLWTHTLACTSDNFVGHNNLGNALLQKGNVDEAIVHYQMALQIKPDFAETHNNLGNALCQKGRVDEAIVYYQKALQINPDDAEVCYNFGNALLKSGRVDEAIANYQRAVRLNPNYAEAHNNLGNALLKMGDVAEAINQFQATLKIKPDSAEACYNIGNALLTMGGVDEAIAYYEKALRIKPDYAEACNQLGTTLLKTDNVDEAIAYYQKALKIKPNNAEVCYNLANALIQKGSLDEAMVHYQEALQIKPDYAEAHINLGNALLQKGSVNEAMVHYQEALRIKPDSPRVLNNLAWLLATSPDAHLRNGVRAVNYAERACELTHYGVSPLVSTLAAAYAEAGRYDDAMAAAQKACALATAAGEPDLLEQNQKLLALYRARQPYHEAAEKHVPAAPRQSANQ